MTLLHAGRTVALCIFLFLALALAAPAQALGQFKKSPGDEQMEYRIYDVSGLAPDSFRGLPPLGAIAPPPGSGGETPRAEPPTDAEIAQKVAARLVLYSTTLTPSLMGVASTPEQHDAFREAIEAVRGESGRLVTVRVALIEVEGESIPSVGSVMNDLGETLVLLETSGRVGRPVTLEATTATLAPAEFNPLVGTQSISYDPEMALIETGFRAEVRIDRIDAGEAEGPDPRYLARIEGEWASVSMQTLRVLTGAVGASTGTAEIEMPRVERRRISTERRVELDAHWRVVASVPDLEDPRRSILLAVSVDEG